MPQRCREVCRSNAEKLLPRVEGISVLRGEGAGGGYGVAADAAAGVAVGAAAASSYSSFCYYPPYYCYLPAYYQPPAW